MNLRTATVVALVMLTGLVLGISLPAGASTAPQCKSFVVRNHATTFLNVAVRQHVTNAELLRTNLLCNDGHFRKGFAAYLNNNGDFWAFFGKGTIVYTGRK